MRCGAGPAKRAQLSGRRGHRAVPTAGERTGGAVTEVRTVTEAFLPKVTSAKLGLIPSRSDVERFALGAYLGVDLSESEADGRKASLPRKRR
jgi:hypothetical protein